MNSVDVAAILSRTCAPLDRPLIFLEVFDVLKSKFHLPLPNLLEEDVTWQRLVLSDHLVENKLNHFLVFIVFPPQCSDLTTLVITRAALIFPNCKADNITCHHLFGYIN